MDTLPLWTRPLSDIPTGEDTLVAAANGTRLCLQVFGEPDAPLQVQLEGYGAQLVNLSRRFCVRLAARGFRVVRLDHRDSGRSQRFPGATYDLRAPAEDVAGLIHVLSKSPAIVCGRSMGGMVAQLSALAHPELVGGLGLFYTAPRTSGGAVPEPGPVLPEDPWVADFVASTMPLAGSGYPYDPVELAALGRLMYARDHDPTAKVRLARAMAATPDWSGRLGSLRCRTAIAHGTEDPLIAPAAGVELASRIPGATLDLFAGMGHGQPPALDDRFVAICAGLTAPC